MSFRHRPHPSLLLALPILGLLGVPILALLLSSSPADVLAGLRHPLFGSAFWLSGRTTMVSMIIIVALGTPLAWWLAVAPPRQTRFVELLVDLPIVLPPAVVGIALLQTFGRSGLFGEAVTLWNVQVPFTTLAVVLAQVTIASPYYIQSAAAGFRKVDPELLLVARTLGQSPLGAFWRIALPLAFPGLLAGVALAWARALGEFGATLLFAGNLPGTTQTMPLAIYMTLESDVRIALALALVLAGASMLLLFALRWIPSFLEFRVETQGAQR